MTAEDAGDSAIGSPYFQSISPGSERATYLAGLIAHRTLPLGEMIDHHELHIYKQWLRVCMRSKMIKHNKDASLDDSLGLLGKLHIYWGGRSAFAASGAGEHTETSARRTAA